MLDEIGERSGVHWVSLLLGVAVFTFFLYTRKRSDRLPPGPAGLPLIGCVLSMRSKDHRATFREMREAYGDIFSFYMGRQLNVVVCGYDALREVFVKKAALFSERPNNFAMKTLRKGKEDQLPVIMIDLFTASFEVTGNTLYWAVLFMMRYPDVLSMVQAELDSHVVADSRPSLSDLPRLPYTEATIMEIQRLADVAPYSLPHTPTVDTIVNGFLIPKGTHIIPNINSVLSDETLWKNPKEFRPERFLDDDGIRVKPEAFIPFFIGRRACRGESLAKMELFLVFSALCQRYSFQSPSNDVVSMEGILGISHCPKPYKVQFVPRLKCQK